MNECLVKNDEGLMGCKFVFLILLSSVYIRFLYVLIFLFLIIGIKMVCLFDWNVVCVG